MKYCFFIYPEMEKVFKDCIELIFNIWHILFKIMKHPFKHFLIFNHILVVSYLK